MIKKIATRSELKLLHAKWKLTGGFPDYQSIFDWEQRNGFSYTKKRAFVHLGYDVDLSSPRSFNEKAIHRRLFSRQKIWPTVTDKVSSRDWVKENTRTPNLRLVPEIDVFSDPRDFDFNLIGKSAVLKAAWASGYNIFLDEPDLSWESIVRKLEAWRSEAYHVNRLVWASHEIERRFIVEEKLTDETGRVPADYKFFIFHGEVELVQLHVNRFSTNYSQAFLDRNLTPINISRGIKTTLDFKVPPRIFDLAEAAKDIGKNFDFARVDLYLCKDKIYFGEITQTPALGFGAFSPRNYDFELGEKWNYPASPDKYMFL